RAVAAALRLSRLRRALRRLRRLPHVRRGAAAARRSARARRAGRRRRTPPARPRRRGAAPPRRGRLSRRCAAALERRLALGNARLVRREHPLLLALVAAGGALLARLGATRLLPSPARSDREPSPGVTARCAR